MGQPYIGEIRMFAGNFAPAGWAFCDGQLLPISENDALFTLIGTTYGGDGESTFALPNLQSRVPIHAGTGGGGSYILAEAAGTESVTLTLQQIPVHSHPQLGSSNAGNAQAPAGGVLAVPQSSQQGLKFYGSDSVAQMNAQSISPVGGSQPHENCQPFLCINFILSLYGIFPSAT